MTALAFLAIAYAGIGGVLLALTLDAPASHGRTPAMDAAFLLSIALLWPLWLLAFVHDRPWEDLDE